MPRVLKTFRLTPSSIQLLAQLSERLECTQTEAVEVALRALARREGLSPGPGQPEPEKPGRKK